MRIFVWSNEDTCICIFRYVLYFFVLINSPLLDFMWSTEWSVARRFVKPYQSVIHCFYVKDHEKGVKLGLLGLFKPHAIDFVHRIFLSSFCLCIWYVRMCIMFGGRFYNLQNCLAVIIALWLLGWNLCSTIMYCRHSKKRMRCLILG